MKKTRSWKFLGWKVWNKIGNIEVGKLKPKWNVRAEVGKFELSWKAGAEVGKWLMTLESLNWTWKDEYKMNNFPSLFKLSNFGLNVSNFARFFPTSLGSFLLKSFFFQDFPTDVSSSTVVWKNVAVWSGLFTSSLVFYRYDPWPYDELESRSSAISAPASVSPDGNPLNNIVFWSDQILWNKKVIGE